MPSPPSIRRAVLTGAGAAFLLFLAGCGDDRSGKVADPAAAVPDVAVEIDDAGGATSYRTAAGEVTITDGTAARLPVDFPRDVYLPADYVVESTLSMDEDLIVGLGVDEDVAALYAAARTGMAGEGWTETMAALEHNGNGLLTFEKDDRSAVLSLSGDGGHTSLGLQLTRIVR